MCKYPQSQLGYFIRGMRISNPSRDTERRKKMEENRKDEIKSFFAKKKTVPFVRQQEVSNMTTELTRESGIDKTNHYNSIEPATCGNKEIIDGSFLINVNDNQDFTNDLMSASRTGNVKAAADALRKILDSHYCFSTCTMKHVYSESSESLTTKLLWDMLESGYNCSSDSGLMVLVDILFKPDPKTDRTAIHYAASSGHHNMVTIYLVLYLLRDLLKMKCKRRRSNILTITEAYTIREWLYMTGSFQKNSGRKEHKNLSAPSRLVKDVEEWEAMSDSFCLSLKTEYNLQSLLGMVTTRYSPFQWFLLNMKYVHGTLKRKADIQSDVSQSKLGNINDNAQNETTKNVKSDIEWKESKSIDNAPIENKDEESMVASTASSNSIKELSMSCIDSLGNDTIIKNLENAIMDLSTGPSNVSKELPLPNSADVQNETSLEDNVTNVTICSTISSISVDWTLDGIEEWINVTHQEACCKDDDNDDYNTNHYVLIEFVNEFRDNVYVDSKKIIRPHVYEQQVTEVEDEWVDVEVPIMSKI